MIVYDVGTLSLSSFLGLALTNGLFQGQVRLLQKRLHCVTIKESFNNLVSQVLLYTCI